MANGFARLEEKIGRSTEENRRYFEILLENTRDHFRVFQESLQGHSGLLKEYSGRLEGLEDGVDEQEKEIAKHDRRLRKLEKKSA